MRRFDEMYARLPEGSDAGEVRQHYEAYARWLAAQDPQVMQSRREEAEVIFRRVGITFAAPDGIPRLRELILKLAMQGKLVPQDPNDSPASELLRSIEAEKKRLVKERKIKAPKTLPEITASDEPYSLPHGWQWVRLGAIGNIFNGNSINAFEKESKYDGVEGLPYIATKDVGYGFDSLDYDNGICIPPDEAKFRIAHQGAVLICAEGGSAGKKCGLPKINQKTLMSLPIPIPPIQEQHRIVAKINRLMSLCNTLDEKIDAAANQQTALLNALMVQM